MDAVGEGAKSFEIIAPTQEIQEQWVSELQAYISAYEADKDEHVFHPPVWQPDDNVVSCPVTGRKFGILVRKHHCRVCGKVVADAGCKNTIEVRILRSCMNTGS